MNSIIIIPTYNERENIEALVERILELNLGLSILIIDDNSPDNTGKIADELSRKYKQVEVIHRLKKEGLGTAYIQGFRYCLERGFEYIFTMDADFSHNPNYLKDFLDRINGFDMVVGSRYTNGISVVNWPLKRIILSLFANNYVRYITGMPLTDCTSGFNCFRKRVLENINLDRITSQGYSFLVEIKYHVFKYKFRITEIPIIFVERREGQTKMSLKEMLEACFIPWKLRFGRTK